MPSTDAPTSPTAAPTAPSDPTRPWLTGWRGEQVVATVGLRRHPAGGLRGALVEALALVLALGADRLQLVAPAEARPDVGPARAALAVVLVGTDRDRTVLLGLDGVLAEVDDAAGWVPALLRAALEAGPSLSRVSAADVAAQHQRCVERGHLVVTP
ncbi:MAG: hypothetical protein ACLGIR_01175 [Actinomycetes bacterium]